MDENIRNRKIAIYTFLEVVAVLIITIVGNLWDFVNLKFDPTQFVTGAYWSNVFVQTVMYSAACICGYLFKIEKLELNDEKFKQIMNEYRELLKHKKESFTRFIDEYYNPNIKKKFIKAKFTRDLAKLDRKAKDEWKLAYYHRFDEGFQYHDEKEKEYCDKRSRLEEMMTDEYLDENFMSIDIKYPKVSAATFTYYLNYKADETALYKVTNNTGRETAVRILSKVVMALLAATVMGLIIFDPSVTELLQQAYGWISLLIKYTLRVVMVVINLLWGLKVGNDIFANNFILPIGNRKRILGEYISWRKDNGDIDTYGDKILESYENQKNLSEVLMDQLKIAERLQQNKETV